jgi:glucose-1-phosphate thymidylyltransferase
MIAILLCAGFGTRMYPLTEQVAKALLPVAGRPVLDYLMDQILEMEGMEEIHLVANNRFISQFEDWQVAIQTRLDEAGVRLTLYNDGVNRNEERLGAVGDLHFVLQEGKLWGKRALVSAGDNIFMFDLRPLWRSFKDDQQNRILGITTDDAEMLKRTGVIRIGDEARVSDFVEKPRNPPTNIFCPPVYFLQPGALELIKAYDQGNHSMDAIGSFIRFLVERIDMYAFKVEGKRLDIGSMPDYELANDLLGKKGW